MIKIVDLGKAFDKYISGYVYKNIGKVKPEEIENKIPLLYEEFGKAPIKELDGKSPEEYYRAFSSEELLDALEKHVDGKVDVPDFLCEAIAEKTDAEEFIAKKLKEENSEEYTMYLLNMLSEKDCKKSLHRLLEFIMFDYTEPVRELSTEILNGYADDVKEEILAQFKDSVEEKKDCFTEILSHANKDDRIFDLLIAEFAKHKDNIPLYAGYLGKYGDERALPFLKTAASSDSINYRDYEELRFAIEVLGGECEERDFSKDKIYKKIKGESEKGNDKAE